MKSILKHPYWEPPLTTRSETAVILYERWERAALKTYRFSHQAEYQAGRINRVSYEASLTCRVTDFSAERLSTLREWFETTHWKPNSRKSVRFAGTILGKGSCYAHYRWLDITARFRQPISRGLGPVMDGPLLLCLYKYFSLPRKSLHRNFPHAGNMASRPISQLFSNI